MATLPIRKIPGLKSWATATVTTAADGLSDVIDIGGFGLRSIQMSTAWTAANMTFNGSVSSSASLKSVRVTTAATELTYVSSSGYIMNVNPNNFAGLRFIQLRSGTTAVPVAQAAARSIVLGLTAIDHPK